jgi:uncharacterized protein (TIGR00251 family)
LIALSPHAGGTILPVKAQPGARKSAIAGVHAGALKVAVAAAPEKGKANAAIAALLVEALGCKASQVTLLAGAAARQKRFLIAGVTPEDLRQRLAALVDPQHNNP